MGRGLGAVVGRGGGRCEELGRWPWGGGRGAMPALPGSVEAEHSGYDPCGWRVASRAHRPGGPGVNRGMALPFMEHPAGPVTVLGQQEPRLCVTVPGPLALLLPSLARGRFSAEVALSWCPLTRGGVGFLSLPRRLVLEASPPQELGEGGGSYF